MAGITVSRQLGSLGTQIARDVAACLNYQMVWREVINEAATRSATPEVALSVIDDLNIFGLRPSYRQRRAYRAAVEQVLHDLARKGDIVIVGRAGQVVLSALPDILHVRVVAPKPVRVERVIVSEQIPADAARARVKESDKSRRYYLRRYYHVDWNDPKLYDLVINTARMTPASATDLICHALSERVATQPNQIEKET